MGYEFFNAVIHPDDVYKWAEMHSAILKFLHEEDFVEEELLYFTCTFRIRSNIWHNQKPSDYLMAYMRLKPVWVAQQLKYGLCLFHSSVIKKAGNLRVYFKGKKQYYLDKKKEWQFGDFLKLSRRERQILMLTKQGLSRKEIIEKMGIKMDTLDNMIKKIFEKLEVESIMQAIIYAMNHRMIFLADEEKNA